MAHGAGTPAAAANTASGNAERRTNEVLSTECPPSDTHGRGHVGAGLDHKTSIPPPTSASREEGLEGGVHLQDKAPAPRPTQPPAAAISRAVNQPC